jgi:hypothetical protein
MQTARRACAWVDRGTLARCPVENAVFALTVETTATALALTVCAAHLGVVVVAAFASSGVPVQVVTVARRGRP